MASGGFQYEPVRLDVSEVCFNEGQNAPNMWEKSSKKVKALLNDADVGNVK